MGAVVEADADDLLGVRDGDVQLHVGKRHAVAALLGLQPVQHAACEQLPHARLFDSGVQQVPCVEHPAVSQDPCTHASV